MRTLFAIFLAIPFFFSCNNSGIPSTNRSIELEVDISKATPSTDISDYVKNIDLIQIEDRPGNLIGEPTKIFKTSNGYVLYDKVVAKRIIEVSNEGKFLKNVIDVGQGPELIFQLNDCWFDFESNFHVYDFSKKIIVNFDKNLNYVNDSRFNDELIFTSLMNVPFSDKMAGFKGFTSFNPPNDGEFYKFALLNKNLGINKTQLFYKKELNDLMSPMLVSPFSMVEKRLIFMQRYDPTIYEVDSNGLSVYYSLIYKNNPLPPDVDNSIMLKNKEAFAIKNNNIDFNKINRLYHGYTGFKGIWLETANYILFESFDKEGKKVTTLHNKVTRKDIAMSRLLTTNKSSKISLPSFSSVDYQNNTLISVWSGLMLKQFLSKDSPLLNKIQNNLEANYILRLELKPLK